MPGLYSSHGTTVSFNGTNIGYLTGFEFDARSGQPVETTNVTSTVVGTGAKSRVVKQYDCTTVEPPTVSITFHGPPSFLSTDAGFKATLSFNAPGNVFSAEAILLTFNHSGRAGQRSTGSATFQMTGKP
jgi:hypothetical protein